MKSPGTIVTVSSSASSKVMTSVVPFIVAETNAGPVVSAGVALVTAWSPKVATATAFAPRSVAPLVGFVYATFTVCTRATASSSVSVTFFPETATGLVSARSTAVPPTLTVNALPAGTESSSSALSKVSVSAAPFTDGKVVVESAGAAGELLVTVTAGCIWRTLLPDGSCRLVVLPT